MPLQVRRIWLAYIWTITLTYPSSVIHQIVKPTRIHPFLELLPPTSNSVLFYFLNISVSINSYRITVYCLRFGTTIARANSTSSRNFHLSRKRHVEFRQFCRTFCETISTAKSHESLSWRETREPMRRSHWKLQRRSRRLGAAEADDADKLQFQFRTNESYILSGNTFRSTSVEGDCRFITP